VPDLTRPPRRRIGSGLASTASLRSKPGPRDAVEQGSNRLGWPARVGVGVWYREIPPLRNQKFADSPVEEDGFELAVPDFKETFLLYRFEPQTRRGPRPVLRTDDGSFTLGAPAMISTPGHRTSRRHQREGCQPGPQQPPRTADRDQPHAEAESLYRRALAIFGKSFGPDHPNVGIARDNLASLMKDTNRQPKAETT
jgi:hypothetical protein